MCVRPLGAPLWRMVAVLSISGAAVEFSGLGFQCMCARSGRSPHVFVPNATRPLYLRSAGFSGVLLGPTQKPDGPSRPDCAQGHARLSGSLWRCPRVSGLARTPQALPGRLQ
eukprot:1889062-Pyramimonas_sp.AAC.1